MEVDIYSCLCLRMLPTSHPHPPTLACPHVHLEYWHGAEEPFHCKKCKVAITDPARLAHEEAEKDKVRLKVNPDNAGL